MLHVQIIAFWILITLATSTCASQRVKCDRAKLCGTERNQTLCEQDNTAPSTASTSRNMTSGLTPLSECGATSNRTVHANITGRGARINPRSSRSKRGISAMEKIMLERILSYLQRYRYSKLYLRATGAVRIQKYPGGDSHRKSGYTCVF